MSPPSEVIRIGPLAKQCGLSPDTLRHYERLGLLFPTRTAGRFREFGPGAARRVRAVQAALAIGFSLAELSNIFAERTSGRAPCRRVRTLAGEKLTALSDRIEELRLIQKHLERTLTTWDERLQRTPAGEPAGLLDLLADGLVPVRAGHALRPPSRGPRR